MTITRAEIKYEMLTRLNKTATAKGFYTDLKLESAIQECCDYIGTEMFLADGGFLLKVDYVTTQAGQVAVPIQPHWAMISDLRYLLGDTYEPMRYDQNHEGAAASPSSGLQQFPARWGLRDNNIYFNPPLAEGGANALEVTYFAYPRRFQSDQDKLDPQFDRCMFWAIIYMGCDKLVGQQERQQLSFGKQADIWVGRMRDILAMRVRQVIPIRDFEG